MKISRPDKRFTKLCHATPGMAVMLVDCDMNLDEEPYLVCVVPDTTKRAARAISQGLYDDERSLFLVSLRTGQLRDMPNLSSRAVLFPNADLQLGEESPKDALASLKCLAQAKQ